MNDQVTSSAVAGQPESSTSGVAQKSGQPDLHELVLAVSAPSMSLSGRDGQIRPGGAHGIYVDDVRVLSQMVLTVDGKEPFSLGVDVAGAVNTFDAFVDVPSRDDPDPAVFVERRRSLHPHGATERFTINSFAPPLATRRVELRLGCDLAGIARVKSGLPTRTLEPSAAGEGLAWEVAGKCLVEVSASPPALSVDAGTGVMVWDVPVGPGAPAVVELALSVSEQGAGAPVMAAPRDVAAVVAPEVQCADHRLVRMLEHSLEDLDCLRMAGTGQPLEVFLAAGAPWYLTLFGRDSIWAARMLLPLGTEIALGTLRALARRQGEKEDTQTSEQPGKILHELRRDQGYDDLSGGSSQHSWLPPVYYGTVDATALWVCLLHDAWRWGAPEEDVVSLLGPLEGCLRWLADYGTGPAGFLTYVDESGRGLSNQGWKDSFNGVQFRDGRLAKAPIALCEVQGYAYEAAIGGARLLEAFDRPGAGEWRQYAHDLKQRFRESFWVSDADGRYPAIALQADGTPVDSVTSNMGHLLGTGIVDEAESELIASRLAAPDMDCGFGLRTLSSLSAGYNPVSYHCGSVWAHDTAIAVSGLARAGGPVARQAAVSLVDGLLAAAEGFDYRLPELYSGATRGSRRSPLPYPAACRPQAWSAAASVAVLGALVGVRPDVPNRALALSPLSGRTGDITVHGLRIGGQAITVRSAAGGAEVLGGPQGLSVVTNPGA